MSNDNLLWQFSLGIYAKAGVKEACLTLQDKHGADVNLLLFLLYQGSLGQQLSSQTIQFIDADISSFRLQVIQPIRDLRKALKGKEYSVDDAEQSLYQSLLNLELSAEKCVQEQLYTLAFESDKQSTKRNAATANLYGYAKQLNIPKPHASIEALLSALDT